MPLPPDSPDFTHVRDGQPTLVNIAEKVPTRRTAVAQVRVALGAAIMARFEHGDLRGPKGPVLQTAIIAGTMAVKNTSTLIPFCHPLPIEQCDFEITPDATGVTLRCTVATTGKTGVEMEAMTGASVAALTIYDMAKALHKGIRIEDLHLVSKTGGKSGDYRTTALCGLVLAGGRSARMGTDKAALRHPDGRTLVRRAYDLLLEIGCETVVISLRPDQEIPPGLEGLAGLTVVRDPEGRSEGPLTGVIAGMKLRPDADWLVLATDLPRLDAATLAHLAAAKHPNELFLAYRSESDGLPEPLAALYAGAAIPVLVEALAAGFKCPRKILIRNSCRLLEPVTPRALDNANTPDDWHAAHVS